MTRVGPVVGLVNCIGGARTKATASVRSWKL